MPAIPFTIAERERRLEAVLREIERRFGAGVVYRLSQSRPRPAAPAIPTGSFGVDRATGGGAPRGRITELSGPASSGKRTLAAHIVAHAQRDGGYAAYIDAAHAFDAERLSRCGADLTDLLLAVPEHAVEALTMVELLAYSGGVDALILDALPFGSRLLEASPAAPLLASGLRRIAAALREAPTAVVVVQEAPAFDRQARTGSGALRRAAALRLLLRPDGPLLHPSGVVVGLRVRAEILANKRAPLAAPVAFEIDDVVGVRRAAEVLDLAVAAGLVSPHPLGLIAGETLLGRTRAQAAARLEAEPALRAQLEERLNACRVS